MIRRNLLALVLLSLAACADAGPTAAPGRRAARPARGDETIASTTYNIFTTQTPASTLSLAGAQEVGTRFYATASGCVTGLRFWRAVSETGTNTLRLWTNSGSQLGSGSVSSGSGWVYVYFSGFACLNQNEYYTVSVNTNTRQARTVNAFSGPITNGPLTAVNGLTGTAGSRPTTASDNNYFVDVVFDTSFVF